MQKEEEGEQQLENEKKGEMGGPGSFSKQIEQGTVVMRTPLAPMTDPFTTKVSSTPDDMVVPHEHDVLSGRGVNIAHHPGNERFRTLVTTRADYSYCTTYSASEKRAVAEEIIRHIQSLSPPGRFLKKKYNKSEDDDDFIWDILSPRDTLKKTCQALRDCNRTDREGYAMGVVPPVDVVQSAAHRAHSGLTGKQHAAAAVAAKNAAAAAAAVTANPCTNLTSNPNRKRPSENPDVQNVENSPEVDKTTIHPNVSVDFSHTNDGTSTGNTPAPKPPAQSVMQTQQSSILAPPNSATPSKNLVPNVTVNALHQQQQPQPMLQNQTIPTPKNILQLPAITNTTKVVGGSINTNQIPPPASNTMMLHPNSLIPLGPSSTAPPPASIKPVNSTSIVHPYKPPQNPAGTPTTQNISSATPVTNQNSIPTTTALHVGNISNPNPPVAVVPVPAPVPINQTGHVTQGQPVNIAGNSVHNVPSPNFAQNNNIPTIIPPLAPSNNNNAPAIPQQFAAANNNSPRIAPQYLNKDSQQSGSQPFSTVFNGNGNPPSNNGPSSQIMTLPPVQTHHNMNNSSTQAPIPMTPIIPSNSNGPLPGPSSMPNNSVQIINNTPLAPPPPRPIASIPTTNSSNVSSSSPLINTMTVGTPNNNPPFIPQNQQGLTIAPLSLQNSNNAQYAQSTQHQLGAPTMQPPPRPMTQPIHSGNNNTSTIPQAPTPLRQQINMGNTCTSDIMRPAAPVSQQTNIGNKGAVPMPQPAMPIPQPIHAGNSNNNNNSMVQPTMALAPPISAGNGPIPTIPPPRIQMTAPVPANNNNGNGSMAQQAVSMAQPISATNTNNSIVQPLIPIAAAHPLSNNNSPMARPAVPMVSPPPVNSNNPPAVSQPIQMRTQIVANNGHSNNSSMPQMIKMPTPIPAGNHTNAPMSQIQMAPPIVAGNNNHATMNRPPMLMTQHIAPNASNPTMLPPAGSTAPSVATGNTQVSTVPKPILPVQPTMTARNPNVIPMTSLAPPNNVSIPPQMTLNSGSMHQPSSETNPAARTPTVIAPALPQANHEPRPQPSLPVNITNGSPLILPPLTNQNTSNNQNNNMPLMRLNNDVPVPAPVTAGPPRTNAPPKPSEPTNSNSSDVGYEWNNSSRRKKLKLVDQLFSEPLPPSYPSALEIADNVRAPASSSSKTSLET